MRTRYESKCHRYYQGDTRHADGFRYSDSNLSNQAYAFRSGANRGRAGATGCLCNEFGKPADCHFHFTDALPQK